MAADPCLPTCSLLLRVRQSQRRQVRDRARRVPQAQRVAEEEAAVGVATVDFWRPGNPKLRRLRPPTLPVAEAEAALAAIPLPAISASASSA
jgi:hypothetical protein